MTQTEAVGVDPGKGRCEDHVLVREADGGNGVRDPFCEMSSAKGIGAQLFFLSFLKDRPDQVFTHHNLSGLMLA